MRRPRKLIALVLFCFTLPAWSLENYYAEEIFKNKHQLDQVNLAKLLFDVLSKAHVQKEHEPDQLTPDCPANTRCIQHKSIGYTNARRVVFGQLFLYEQKNRYALEDIYCDRLLGEEDFPKGKGPGPDKIPAIEVVNTEHAWPQSRFSNRFSKSLQKADLHILFATSSSANNLRGNHPFGEVRNPIRQVCPASALGLTSSGKNPSFLPPQAIRGDLARANFYFSIRYKLPIDPEQETTLRAWHNQDPVDAAETERQELKFRHTEVRNPFIDHPDWVDLIKDF